MMDDKHVAHVKLGLLFVVVVLLRFRRFVLQLPACLLQTLTGLFGRFVEFLACFGCSVIQLLPHALGWALLSRSAIVFLASGKSNGKACGGN
jgi:hypothetical protein